jgi:hypothetical protein
VNNPDSENFLISLIPVQAGSRTVNTGSDKWLLTSAFHALHLFPSEIRAASTAADLF